MNDNTKTDQDIFLEFVKHTGKEYEAIQHVNMGTQEKISSEISLEVNRREIVLKFFSSGNLAAIRFTDYTIPRDK